MPERMGVRKIKMTVQSYAGRHQDERRELARNR
jgi:hypothetical protein